MEYVNFIATIAGSEIVRVYVKDGEDDTFMMHKQLLKRESAYFNASLNDEIRKVEFPDILSICLHNAKTKDLKIFQQWVYGQTARWNAFESSEEQRYIAKATAVDQIATTRNGKVIQLCPQIGTKPKIYQNASEWSKSEEGFLVVLSYDQIVDQLLDVYIFASQHDTYRLRNDVMSAIWYLNSILGKYVGLSCVRKAYVSLETTCPFYQYLVKSGAAYYLPAFIQTPPDFANTLPHPFLERVSVLNSQRANAVYVDLVNSKGAPPLSGMPSTDCDMIDTLPDADHPTVNDNFERIEEEKGESQGQGETDPLKLQLRNPCLFHEHYSQEEADACMNSSVKDDPCVRSLLVSCIATVREQPWKCFHSFHDDECACDLGSNPFHSCGGVQGLEAGVREMQM